MKAEEKDGRTPFQIRIDGLRCPKCGGGVRVAYKTGKPDDPMVYCLRGRYINTPPHRWSGLLSQCATEKLPRVEEWEVTHVGGTWWVCRGAEAMCKLSELRWRD